MDHHLDRAGTPQQAYDLRVVQRHSLPYDSELSGVVAAWLCARAPCLAG
jgi:hypothetical protein